MKNKISKIKYKPFDKANALSIDEINDLQKDCKTMRYALELMIIDIWVALTGKEPSDSDLKKEVDDYIKQAEETLKGVKNE